MRPKLTDVAKLAGVSLATADRVINQRPGVRPITREKVFKAIEELGYRPDPAAASLAKRARKTVTIIVPHDIARFAGRVEESWFRLRQLSKFSRVDLKLETYSIFGDDQINRVIEKAASASDAILVCAINSQSVKRTLEEIENDDCLVYTYLTPIDVAKVHQFFGYDYYRLGRMLAYFLMLLSGKEPGLLLDHTPLPMSDAYRDRIQGTEDFVKLQNWQAELVSLKDPLNQLSCVAHGQELIEQGKHVTGIMCWGDTCSPEFAKVWRDSQRPRPKIIVMVLFMSSWAVKALQEETIDAIFFLDSNHAVHDALEQIVEDLDNSVTHTSATLPGRDSLEFKIIVKENIPNWCLELIDSPE